MVKLYKDENIKKGVEELAFLIKNSGSAIVLTGAGMDTESNIPDFRSKKGWWKNIDPRTVASVEALAQNYPLFHEFYTMRLKLLESVEPHPGHYVLADLEKRGIIKSISTQNIAGLHTLAGSQRVYELHGNIRIFKCNSCGQEASSKDFLTKEKCRSCGDRALRPNVVLFGEALPQDTWQAALAEIEGSDLLIVIGTSLEVYPVNQLPLIAKGKKVFINYEDRGEGYSFDIRIIGKAKEVLEEVYKLL